MTPPELPNSRERKATILTTATNEKLISIADRTNRLQLINYICDIIVDRYVQEPSLEYEMILEHLRYRQKVILEVNALQGVFNLEADESVAFEEAVNEALFKPMSE